MDGRDDSGPQTGPPMEPPVGNSQHTLAARLVNIIEILAVALAGPLLAQLGFALGGISNAQLLGNVYLVVALMLTEASITLPIILGLVWLRGQSLRSIGWGRGLLRKEALVGLAFLPVLFGSTILISQLFQHFAPEYVTQKNPLLDLIQTPWELGLMILSSLYVGGLKEELQRAFVLTRFEENLGGVAVGLGLWSLFFAFGHVIQGLDNAVAAGVLGLLFGVLFIRRRSVTGPIVAHASYDILTLLVYWKFIAVLS
jgi:membrane protease YdiL (CAAX protease family)